jgi:hypothetical protein
MTGANKWLLLTPAHTGSGTSTSLRGGGSRALAFGFERGESVSPADLPRFTVLGVLTDRCTGRFDPSPWVGENWITGLHLGGSRFLWGRFHDVDAAARTCSFCPNRILGNVLRPPTC